MAYPEFSDPATPLRDAASFDGISDDLVPSGFVESRIRQLNIISSNDNLNAQYSPYAANTREGADVCSPACPRTRVEVSASPPVGHSYPGLRINDNHSDDNGVAWEVASTSAHMFNIKPNLRGSRSSNSLRFKSPTRGPSKFRSLHRLNQSANEAADTKPGFKLSIRAQANPPASFSSIQTRQEAPESSRNEQQDVLEMFDMYGVSRPEGWLSDERDQQQASGMKPVQVCHSCGGYLHTRSRCARCGHEFCSKCKTELVSGLSTNLSAGRDHEQGQQKLKPGTWDQGITHSRSLADMSEPVLDRDTKIHRLSHSKSRDSITGYPKESRPGHAEAERQARQQFRYERRHRLERSHNEMTIPEQCSDCPTCHVNSDPSRHSICCVARHSPSKWQAVDRADTSNEKETYKRNSKASFEIASRTPYEAELHTVPATSPSSEYTSAEPRLIRQPEREILSQGTSRGKTVPPSQESHIQDKWPNNDRQILPRQKVDDLENETATQTLKGLLSLHTLEQDTFWTCSEGPGTSQCATLPHALETGSQNGPKSTMGGTGPEGIGSTDFRRSQASPPGKAMWNTPTIRISPSGQYDDGPKSQQDVKYAQMGRTGEQQLQGVLQKGVGSPVRKANNLTPKTPKSESKETLGSPGSRKKVASTSTSPQRNIESLDPSTWKQQLRKVNGTPVLMNSSSIKGYTLLASDSQRHLGKSSAAVVLEEEAFPSSSTQHKTNGEEQTSKGYIGLESTSYVLNNHQAGDAMKESTMPSDIPDSDPEMPISRHICEWRSRYLGLSAAFDKLKMELDIALERQTSQDIADGELGSASYQHQYNDDGIEGLTIIVHRRCKEDLVLNTDLREEELAHVGKQ